MKKCDSCARRWKVISNLADEVERLQTQVEHLKYMARHYPRVAGKNIRLQEANAKLEKALQKAVDTIDFKHRPLFSAVELLLMGQMKDDIKQLDLAFQLCKNYRKTGE